MLGAHIYMSSGILWGEEVKSVPLGTRETPAGAILVTYAPRGPGGPRGRPHPRHPRALRSQGPHGGYAQTDHQVEVGGGTPVLIHRSDSCDGSRRPDAFWVMPTIASRGLSQPLGTPPNGSPGSPRKIIALEDCCALRPSKPCF